MTVFKFADGRTTDDKVSLWPSSNRDSKTFLLGGLEHKQFAVLGLDRVARSWGNGFMVGHALVGVF